VRREYAIFDQGGANHASAADLAEKTARVIVISQDLDEADK